MIETRTYSAGTIARLFDVPWRFVLDLMTDPWERAVAWHDRRRARLARQRRYRQSFARRGRPR